MTHVTLSLSLRTIFLFSLNDIFSSALFLDMSSLVGKWRPLPGDYGAVKEEIWRTAGDSFSQIPNRNYIRKGGKSKSLPGKNIRFKI